MSTGESIPAAWLRPFPDGYKLPVWRWFLLPATTYMAYRSGGVWISGTLQKSEQGLHFAPTKVSALNRMAASWSLGWDEIRDVEFVQGIAIDKIALHHEDGVISLQSARSAPFFERVQSTLRTKAGGDDHA